MADGDARQAGRAGALFARLQSYQQELLAMLEGVVAQTRIDRAAAQQLLALLAIGCRT